MGHADRGGAVPGYTMQKEQLQTRLRRIEGQVRGVARMIDEDKYCVDVVTQVAAIQAALDKVSLGLLDGHIRGCVREEIQAGGGDARVDELLQVMDRVLRRGGAAAVPGQPRRRADGRAAGRRPLACAGTVLAVRYRQSRHQPPRSGSCSELCCLASSPA
jgi:CsoR family transcriptional regulator, copper-sensing transcriptional repressor